MTTSKGPISRFIENYYLHFNAAALVDAAKAYEVQLQNGAKMLVSLAGAMSTAELGKIFADVIRKDKVHIISVTGANLEEDLMNLVAHSHYERVPHYRDLTPQDEWKLLERMARHVRQRVRFLSRRQWLSDIERPDVQRNSRTTGSK